MTHFHTNEPRHISAPLCSLTEVRALLSAQSQSPTTAQQQSINWIDFSDAHLSFKYFH